MSQQQLIHEWYRWSRKIKMQPCQQTIQKHILSDISYFIICSSCYFNSCFIETIVLIFHNGSWRFDAGSIDPYLGQIGQTQLFDRDTDTTDSYDESDVEERLYTTFQAPIGRLFMPFVWMVILGKLNTTSFSHHLIVLLSIVITLFYLQSLV